MGTVEKLPEVIIDNAEPGREVDYLLYEIRSSLEFLGLDQRNNRYAQNKISEVENYLDALEYFLKNKEVY